MVRAARRRTAKGQVKAVTKALKDQELLDVANRQFGNPGGGVMNITLADVKAVIDEMPQFRLALVNAALRRELAEARTALATHEDSASADAG